VKKISIIVLSLASLLYYSSSAQTNEERNLDYFDQLKVYGPFRVYLEKGTEQKISISSYEWLDDEIITEVKNNRLKIKMRNETKVLKDQDHRRVRIFLTYTNLNDIQAVAGADLLSRSTIETGRLNLSVTKGATCDLDVEVAKLEITINTGGVLHLEGVAKSQESSVHTGGVLNAFYLESEDVYIKAHTGGIAEVRANQSIEAKSGTGGSITYRGRPQIRDLNTSLGGSISGRY